MKEIDTITPSTTSQIYNTIRREGQINRMGITEKSGVSKSTVSLQTNKLINLGLIEEIAPDNGCGQRKLKLSTVGRAGFVAGVLLGTHRVSILIFDLNMDVIKESCSDLEDIADPEACNRIIISKLQELRADAGIKRFWGIGMGFPFPVDFRQGKPDSPPNVPRWHGFPLKEMYESAFDCPVLIDNDVNVMAWGEGFHGCTARVKNYIFIKAGTGIGAGIVVEGRIYRGANGCAGDVGHIAVDGSTVRCHCGNTGCLEAVTGGHPLAGKAKQKAVSGESSYLKAVLSREKDLCAADISAGAVSGDLACIQLIQEAGTIIGEVCAKLVNFFNPSTIVIGGGLANFGNLFIGSIRDAIYKRSLHLATFELAVKPSELKEKAGPYGAGTLILDHIFSSEEFGHTISRNLNQP